MTYLRSRLLAGGIVLATIFASSVNAEERLDDGRVRFVDHGDVVEDRKTGLFGEAAGSHGYEKAFEYARHLKLKGVGKWRLPTALEFSEIFPATQLPFVNSQYVHREIRLGPEIYVAYWISDRPKNDDGKQAYSYRWYAKGGPQNQFIVGASARVRCVREPLKDNETLLATERNTPKVASVSKTIQRPQLSTPMSEELILDEDVNLREGLLAAWTFDSAANGRLLDSAGENSVQMHGGNLQIGLRGNGWWQCHWELNVISQMGHCDLGDSERLNFKADTDFTFSMWVFPKTMAGCYLCAFQNTKTNAHICLCLSPQSHHPVIYIADDNGQPNQSTYVFSNRAIDEQWHHVAFCRRQGALELYCDGLLSGTRKDSTTSGSITTDLRTLGQDRKTLLKNQKSQIHEKLHGALDEFYIYSRALNRTEIKRLSERHFPVEIKSLASPVKYSGTQYVGRCAVRNEDNTSQDKVKERASP